MKSKWSLLIYLISVSAVFGCSNFHSHDRKNSGVKNESELIFPSGDPYTGKYHGSAGEVSLTLRIKMRSDG